MLLINIKYLNIFKEFFMLKSKSEQNVVILLGNLI